MNRTRLRRSAAGAIRLLGTAVVSTALTITVMTVMKAEPASTAGKPVVIVEGERLYPAVASGESTVTYLDHEALLSDFAALKADVSELRRAADYDASHGGLSASLHEWADRRPAGSFGGGRNP